MNIAICVRRAIVEHELRPPCSAALFLQASIVLLVFPNLEHLRLPLGQIPSHREIGLRQLQRRLILRVCCQSYNLP